MALSRLSAGASRDDTHGGVRASKDHLARLFFFHSEQLTGDRAAGESLVAETADNWARVKQRTPAQIASARYFRGRCRQRSCPQERRDRRSIIAHWVSSLLSSKGCSADLVIDGGAQDVFVFLTTMPCASPAVCAYTGTRISTRHILVILCLEKE